MEETHLAEPLLEIEEVHLQHADENHPSREHRGSSVRSAILNFTNSIVGAGAIGLGGALAQSGGFVSIAAVLYFAFLTKLSLDLLVRLTLETPGTASYEDLAQAGFGKTGKLLVVASKFSYSFGCLIAYIIVIKDNFGPAMRSIIYASSTSSDSFLYWILGQEFWMTWAVSSLIVLPLCLLRDMTPLASLSLLSNLCMFCIVAIVIYLYAKNPNNEIRHTGQGLYKDWFEVRPGLLDNLGTFVFTFVSQHVVHLAFDSLKPELKTYHHWQRVSSWSLLIAGTVSLSVAIFVYISFWQAAESDIFAIYPAVLVIDTSKILLCMTMLLTFPFPFFSCRELLILTFFQPPVSVATENQDSESNNDLEQSLCDDDAIERATSISFTDLSVISEHAQAIISSALLPNNNKQLKLPYHVSLTVKLWAVVTGLAIAAPSLGDVLDLVGCASGTLIAFIFPAILALRLQGYGHTAMAILITGGLVGSVGTIFSLKKLVQDIFIKAI